MNTSLLAPLGALLIVAAAAAPAFAGNSAAPGQNKDALIAYYTTVEPTGSPTPGGTIKNLGGAISGGFFGNTSNAGVDIDAPDSGHGVTPSISPGPQVNGDGFCSLGGYMHGNC
jgi:hypothetical protein